MLRLTCLSFALLPGLALAEAGADDPLDIQVLNARGFIEAAAPAEDGGAFVVGTMQQLTGSGNDGWVVRLDPCGTILWEAVIPGRGLDALRAVAPLEDGSSFVAGSTVGGTARGDTGWLMKLDPEGAVLWERHYGGGSAGFAGVAPLPDGGAVLTGQAWRDGAQIGFVLRVDAEGAPVWASFPNVEGGVRPRLEAVAVLPDLSIVAVGHARDPNSRRRSWAWAMRMGVDGAVIWEWTISDRGWTAFSDVAVVPEGLVLVGSRDRQGWAVGLDAGGTVLWEERFGARRFATLSGVAALPDGGIVIAGAEGRDEESNRTGFAARLDRGESAGGPWQLAIKAGRSTKIDAMALLSDGTVLLVGNSFGADPRLVAGFVARTDAIGQRLRAAQLCAF